MTSGIRKFFIVLLTTLMCLTPFENMKAFADDDIPVTEISLGDAGDGIVLDIGEQFELAPNVVVLPENATDKTVTYSVNPGDESVVSVDSGGTITALEAGIATVTVTAVNGVAASVTVEVTEPFVYYDVNYVCQGNTVVVQSGRWIIGNSFSIEDEIYEGDLDRAVAVYVDGSLVSKSETFTPSDDFYVTLEFQYRGEIYSIETPQEYEVGSDGSYALNHDGVFLMGVLIDGNAITQPQYEEGDGCIIISPSFMDSLSLGQHDVTIQFLEGYASASFTVRDQEVPEQANIHYSYGNDDYPYEVLSTIPSDIHFDAGTFEPTDPVSTYVYGPNYERWAFDGWDQSSVVIEDGEEVTFTGHWTNQGTAYALLTQDELIFFRSNRQYSSDDEITVTLNNAEYSGIVITGFEPYGLGVFDGRYTVTSIWVAQGHTIYPEDMNSWFSGFRELTSFDASGFDTSNVRNMEYLFGECSSLTSLDLSGFNTEKVETMYMMFNLCRNLQSVDISDFSMDYNTNTYGMFENCERLTTIVIGEDAVFSQNPWFPSGTWTNDDLGLSYNSEDLWSIWDADMAGTWTRELVYVTDVEIWPITIYVGMHGHCSFNILPDNVSVWGLDWSVDDPTVAIVDGEEIIGVAPGTATVRATARDGSGVYAEATVTVLESPAAGRAFAVVVGNELVLLRSTEEPEYNWTEEEGS
ncbi:MAG: BspA family leucine-rich repeat surface protein, partial [Erysipelotrichaceae bacterium]|nr:BspA family leucine-rich repeat surface protein [Erysipelotrichaceae bacterium]